MVKKLGIWAHFPVVVPAVKGNHQERSEKKTLVAHLGGIAKTKKCSAAPLDVARIYGTKSPARVSAQRQLFTNDGVGVPRSSTCTATQEELELSFAEMCYATGIPFRVVQDSAVKHFFAQACPGFRLPSRQRIAGQLLDTVYKKRKAAFIAKLKGQTHLALSSDGWSNTNNQSIINFMLASPDMKPVFWSSIATGEAEHTGAYIADCVNRVIDEVETAIGVRGTICSVVTDNAKNMKAAWEELKQNDHICIALVAPRIASI
ncbi:Hypothetical protein PHPALM_2686 [Phytophthora palmivora]|uniref:DUF659 domain-containing protein n=1 Tax=Phytophthora palmivora TaxID=4796 RepID=A0A2P4YP70_9STRA|nr:Hypothetical protein PHPALM_2686 [Phytophthora palmivora]